MRKRPRRPVPASTLSNSVTAATPWWEFPDKDIGTATFSAASRALGSNGAQTTKNYRSSMLYDGNSSLGAGRFSRSMIAGDRASGGLGGARSSYTSPRYNLIFSGVQTVVSKMIAGGIPAVSIITNDGNWEQQHKAELLNDLVEGLFYLCKVPLKAVRALKDAAVFGTGFVKGFSDENNNIHVERIHPQSICCEFYDGKDEAPRTLYHVDIIDRDVLAARFPSMKAEIEKVTPISQNGEYTADIIGTRMIPFVESWHLPSSKGAKDGKHVVATSNVTLLNESWCHDRFPVAVMRFDDSLSGYYGRGIAELGYSYQSAMTTLQKAEYRAWGEVGTPRIAVEESSHVNEDHLMSSKSSLILRYRGVAPQVLNWSGTSPDFVNYKMAIVRDFYESLGISQTNATGNKPVGLTSGAAQREYQDIQSDRFSMFAENWQAFFVDLAQVLILTCRDVYAKDDEFKVRTIGKSFLEEIPWAMVDMDDDCFRLKVFPVNGLPRTPAGRLQAVQEMMQANLITREEGLKLLKLPDLDDALSLENARQNNARFTAYRMLHLGQYVPPDNIQDLQLCIETVTKEALKAQDAGAPPDRVALCRRWLVQAKGIMQPPAPPMAPPGAAAPGAPPGMPPGPPLAKGAPPPVNSMLPFAQQAA